MANNIDPTLSNATVKGGWFGAAQRAAQRRKDAEALRTLQAQSEEAAIYNRAALAVGASQAQQHARALADAALTTPSEKPEVVTGTQAKRKRGGVTIRI